MFPNTHQHTYDEEWECEVEWDEEECPPTVRSTPSPIIPSSREIRVEVVERKEMS